MATARRVNELKLTSDLEPEEKILIQESFRESYVDEITCWTLLQKVSKRKKLFSFLKSHTAKSRSTPTLAMPPLIDNSDTCIVRTKGAAFRLSLNYNVTHKTKRIERNRFASTGIEKDGLFGTSIKRPTTAPVGQKRSLPSFILNQLMRTEVASRLEPLAEENFALLKELQNWVDKKCNVRPVTQIHEPSELRASKMRRICHASGNEDHVFTKEVNIMKPSITRQVYPAWRTPMSSYSTQFQDEGMITRSRPIMPITLSRPFCLLPDGDNALKPPVVVSGLSDFQERREFGRKYKQIFQSKTVL